MKKITLFTALIVLINTNWALSGNIIKSNMPVDQIPSPKKCASCHKTENVYNEFSSSIHRDLECFDCHLPSVVQKVIYKKEDRGFFRLGYHKQDDAWEEAVGNEVCKRCHDRNEMIDTTQKCWTCHMPENGKDHIIIVKDFKKPPIQDNIKEIKILSHRSHGFKVHFNK